MTEDDARGWIADHFGAPAIDRLTTFVDLLLDENRTQNLIAPSTIPQMWVRHVVDSAQLLDHAPPGWSTWLDIGTGGGFPGLVIALLAPDRHVTMIEPRRRRAEFLRAAGGMAGAPRASVIQAKAEAVSKISDIVSARAVASLAKTLAGAARCADAHTTWILPRGGIDASTADHLRALRSTMFHVEHSLTDPESSILVLEGNGR